jgi:hypothetical protein
MHANNHVVFRAFILQVYTVQRSIEGEFQEPCRVH